MLAGMSHRWSPQHRQHLSDRCVTLSPHHVWPLVAFAVLEVDRRDEVVVVPQIGDRVMVGSREMSDVEICGDRRLVALGDGAAEVLGANLALVRVDARMVVHRDRYPVLRRHSCDSRHGVDLGRGSDRGDTERLCHFEPTTDLRV